MTSESNAIDASAVCPCRERRRAPLRVSRATAAEARCAAVAAGRGAAGTDPAGGCARRGRDPRPVRAAAPAARSVTGGGSPRCAVDGDRRPASGSGATVWWAHSAAAVRPKASCSRDRSVAIPIGRAGLAVRWRRRREEQRRARHEQQRRSPRSPTKMIATCDA